MSTASLVLGWAEKGAPCPAHVSTHCLADVTTLTVPAQTAPDPRARLQQQVLCFNTGLDFLPAAAAIRLSEADGINLAATQKSALLSNLARLSGMGQMTLAICRQKPTCFGHTAENGRHWLKLRQAAQTASDKFLERTMQFYDEIGALGFETRIRETASTVYCDVLVPRLAFKNSMALIQQNAESCDHGGQSLIVTGPWPPFSFAKPFYVKTPM